MLDSTSVIDLRVLLHRQHASAIRKIEQRCQQASSVSDYCWPISACGHPICWSSPMQTTDRPLQLLTSRPLSWFVGFRSEVVIDPCPSSPPPASARWCSSMREFAIMKFSMKSLLPAIEIPEIIAENECSGFFARQEVKIKPRSISNKIETS